MNPQNISHTGSLRDDPIDAGQTLHLGGLLALLEIAVATTIVVGFFHAISQPFGWPSVVQLVLCACLAGLLWLADARQVADDALVGNSAAAFAGHESVPYES